MNGSCKAHSDAVQSGAPIWSGKRHAKDPIGASGVVVGTCKPALNSNLARGPQKLTISRTLTSLSVAAAVAAGALMPLASTANAGSRHYGGGYGARHYDGGYAHGYAGRDYGHGGYYRKKRRNNVGPAIALGIGALMLGVIASEHRRGRRY